MVDVSGRWPSGQIRRLVPEALDCGDRAPAAIRLQVDGYRLIIKDGAMAGLAYDEFPWPWGDARYDEVTVDDSWSGWMAAGPYILGRDGL